MARFIENAFQQLLITPSTDFLLLLSHPSLVIIFFGTCRRILLAIFVSFSELPVAIWPLILTATAAIHLSKGLPTATPCRTDEIVLHLGISKQYGTSNSTNFHSTSSLFFSTNCFTWYSCRGCTTTYVASWSTAALYLLLINSHSQVRHSPAAPSEKM